MAPSKKRSSPRTPRKHINARKITKTSRSPTSILAQARKNNLIKALGISTTGQSKSQDRQAKKYSKYKRGVLPVSHKLFEQNCFEREPLPSGYVFVPRGDVYVTRHCRSKTREARRVVYLVYVSSLLRYMFNMRKGSGNGNRIMPQNEPLASASPPTFTPPSSTPPLQPPPRAQTPCTPAMRKIPRDLKNSSAHSSH